ncbi:MAG TPA: helix-hairpin-helix domain-containing protein [Flavobacteriales bacterium]|nr:helix-hairpin-helix domain-containing protein [Flavobacteriales bacterium]
MMDPFTEVYTTGLACLVPVSVVMLGTLILGTLIGLVSVPGNRKMIATLQVDLEGTRKKLAESEDKLALSGSILRQRLKLRDDEAAAARLGLEQEISTLNAEVNSLKMALVATKRSTPTSAEMASRHVERAAADPAHLTRIAALEKEAARVPVLIKELDELYQQVNKTPKKTPPSKVVTKPQPLPEQVFRVMSGTFGKRIEQDDLKLVEGIGPKIAEQLTRHGLKTWADIAAAKPAQIKKVLEEAGDRFHLHDPSTWPEQCKMMVEHRWDELRKYQRKLSNAR